MGCSPQVEVNSEFSQTESSRIKLSSQYSSLILNKPFQYKVTFSQGISVDDIKKSSETIKQPCQIVDDDPIYYEEFVNESSFINESINQSHSSKGILKSSKNLTQKTVRFEQIWLSKYYLETRLEVRQEAKDKKKTKRKYKKLQKGFSLSKK